MAGEKEVKQEEKEIEKAEPTITQEDLMKAVSALEELVKARDEEDEDEKDEEEEDEGEEEEEEKSFAGNFEENETLEKAVEVSDFLAALVDETETSVDALGRELVRMEKSMDKFDSKFIESLGDVAIMLKAVTDKLDAFDARLKVIEQTPSAPRSIMKAAQPIEKSFNTGGEPEGLDTLTRRQKIEIMEKAVADGKLKDTVLFNYEADHLAPLSDETKAILKSYVK